MKAKDYYEKYKNDLQNPETCNDACIKIYTEMLDEVEEICKKRNVKLLSGQIAVLKEENQKGNALAKMLPILKRDFFKNMILLKNPYFEEYWDTPAAKGGVDK